MKHFFLFFVLFATSAGILQSQDSSSLLQQYKFRTHGFRALQLNVNAAGDFTDAKRINADDGKSNQINSAFQITYFRIVSTDKRQHQSSIQLNPSYNQIQNETGSAYQRFRNLNLQANWNRIDRFYNSRNFFFEIGNELVVSGGRQKNASDTRTFISNNNYAADKLIIGVGKGRIENIQDAQMALFIVNDLRRSGLLQQEPDAATMYELAVLITDINNRRVFDNRIRRIYELTRLDSFFQSKQLIATPSIAYFTTVNDNWALAFNPGRFRGTRLYAQVNPGIRFDESGMDQKGLNINEFNSNSKTFSYFYSPEIGIEHYKPVGLHWQQNVTASLQFQQTFTRQKLKTESTGTVTENENFSTLPEVLFHSFYGFGYYPNNRTIVNAGLNFDASYGKGFWEYYILSPGVRVNADYFINYRTRLFLTTGLNYRYTDVKNYVPGLITYDKNLITANFNFGLSHFIF